MTGSLDDLKQRILKRADIADVIGDTVSLQHRSGHLIGLCPFHGDKNPSFHVYDDHYHCYACKAHGDVIEFVRQSQGLSYPETLKSLAARYSVEAPELERSSKWMGQQKQIASLYKLMAEAQRFYQEGLHSDLGHKAMEYLRSRGFSDDNIKAFGFGVTPSQSYGLVRHLRAKGYSIEDLTSCSLATLSSRDGRPFDFFLNRLMIPIRDKDGRVIAFGGRTLGDHPAKYMNSRDSRFFDKSQTLFGFDRARQEIRKRGRAIIVEGYMDALQLWQQGFGETVACLGTAFTSRQLGLLRHSTTRAVLLFDGDRSGLDAMLKSVRIALDVPSVEVRAALLPPGEDPDSFVRKEGPDALESLLASSTGLFDLAVKWRLQGTHELAIPDLVGREFVPWLAQIPDRMQRSYLMTRIAQITGISASLIEQQLRPIHPGAIRAKQTGAAKAAPQVAQEDQGVGEAFMPLKELDKVGFELFGHIYHSTPEELEVSWARDACRREFDLDSAYLALMEEMLDVLEAGGSPSEHDAGSWSGTVCDELLELVKTLHDAKAAFAAKDRRKAIQTLIDHSRAGRDRAMLAAAKARLNKLAASPQKENELLEVLQLIQTLTKKTTPRVSG